ncbi:MAG: hypothetical protein P8M78_00865 [Myxococcota bacterium]|nr:hypothetical protein [Myxococcota bacterium]
MALCSSSRFRPLPMNPEKKLLSLCIFLALLSGCSETQPIILSCEDAMGLHAICGLQNPEDLALLPGGKQVIVSQFGLMDGSQPGSIGIFDLGTEDFRIAYPDPQNTALPDHASWGDPNCPGPPSDAFSPHGIDLATRPDGSLRLLVVNHGGRESIEFFEVTLNQGKADLRWRGCALPPENSALNDVVNLPDGGFLTTHMFPMDRQALGTFEAAVGLDTGFVLEWHPESGWSEVPGSRAPFPNGIELSEDGRTLFVNVYMAGEVRKIDRITGERLGTAYVESPDNSSWSRNGQLLVASHEGGLSDHATCYGLQEGACPMPFKIVVIEPDSMRTETVFRNEGPPMGAGTIALDLGSEFLIGSFASDRMIRVPMQIENSP